MPETTDNLDRQINVRIENDLYWQLEKLNINISKEVREYLRWLVENPKVRNKK